LKHLKNTVLGTPGRLRYQLTSIEEKLDHIQNIDFMVLTRQEKLLGSVGFIQRDTWCFGKEQKSYYVRFFSINAPLRSRKLKKEKFRERSRGSNIVKDISLPYTENPAKLKEDFDPGEKNLVYSYVESDNFRSMNFSEMMRGETIGKNKTFIFSRLRPKTIKGFRKIKPNEKKRLRYRIQDKYEKFNLFTDENIFIDDNYFVLEKEGEIIMGAQVHPEKWRVMDMKGRLSKFMLKIMPYLPLVRKIFNPRAFRFLAVEGIWYRKGSEIYFNAFFEAICHHFGMHFLLTWADTGSDLFKDMDANLDFGVIGSTFQRNEVDIRVTFNNFSEEDKRVYFESPSYVSAYDMV
ncbi:MAG: hypothetical protein ACP5E3_00175, partial [Bacteroidales bacterium]